MKTMSLTVALCLTLLCALFAAPSQAGEALEVVEAEVTATADKIDQNYGVLLTTFERSQLKISIVARKTVGGVKGLTAQEIKSRADKAYETYEITDPAEQRKLLIEMAAQTSKVTGNGNGNEPP